MSETADIDWAIGRLAALETSVGHALVGQRQVVREVTVALAAAGHVLLVRALARAVSGRFGRI